MSSRSLNNRATRDAVIFACVLGKHVSTGSGLRGRGFATGSLCARVIICYLRLPPPSLSLSLPPSLPPSLWYDNLQSFVYQSWNGFMVRVQAPFVLCFTLFRRLEASTENGLDQNQQIRSANLNGRNCPAMTALFQLPPTSVSL